MQKTFFRVLGCAAFTGSFVACSDSTSPPAPPAAIAVSSGGNQTGTVGTQLATPLVARVTTSGGVPVQGVAVLFKVSVGNGSLSAGRVITTVEGKAQTSVTLGPMAGPLTVTATVERTALSASFSLVAAPVAVVECTGPGTVLSLGQILTALPGSTVCLSGGASGGDYALVAFNGAADPGAMAGVTVEARGNGAAATMAAADRPAAELGRQGALASLALGSASRSRDDFHGGLRRMEAALETRLAGARQWMANRRRTSAVSLKVIPSAPTVGQTFTLNASGTDACDVPLTRTGRVVAITNRAIVVADVDNPAGGFTDAEYQSIGVTFDTLVDPVDTRAFGQPTDIDGNGRIVLFYTSAVNGLAPANNTGAFTAGFFFARDLFPATTTNSVPGCATSNVGEIVYLMVPDPNGAVNGNKFTKATVQSRARSLLAHEYQHLINSARRLYISTTATEFEEVWLNEGLSHIAEELLFYAETGLEPHGNIDIATLRLSQRYLDAANGNMISNFGRYADFLENTEANSPYADDSKLPTRGAIWSFLRYAADRSSTPDATEWYQLVNSGLSGRANLAQTFGSGVTLLFRDWATSLIADDFVPTDVAHQQPSWDFRDIYAELIPDEGFPLATRALTSGTPVTVSPVGGGSSFLRFSVGAGATSSIALGSGPSEVSFTIIRTR